MNLNTIQWGFTIMVISIVLLYTISQVISYRRKVKIIKTIKDIINNK